MFVSGWYVLYFIGVGVVTCAVVAVTAVLYQYATFNSCPPGTRPLPSPKGRLPLVGHRYLIDAVQYPIEHELISRHNFVKH